MTPLKKMMTALPLNQVENYLMGSGWLKDAEIRHATIWHRPESGLENLEVMLPKHQEIKDFQERMANVVYELAEFEKRTPESMIYEIENYSLGVSEQNIEQIIQDLFDESQDIVESLEWRSAHLLMEQKQKIDRLENTLKEILNVKSAARNMEVPLCSAAEKMVELAEKELNVPLYPSVPESPSFS
ncbi:MAG TPA: hypothetical protein VIY47_15430 [Ignavibacteriaceae bacterium]